jgi:hypothetical protein
MPSQHHSTDTSPDLNKMLEYLEKLLRPKREASACGLTGQVTIRDESRLRAFRLALAELMVTYDVDKLDVAWQVPLVVKESYSRRDRDPEPAEV